MSKKLNSILITILSSSVAVLYLSSCGSSSSNSAATVSSTLSSFAQALSEDMVIASPTAQRTVAASSLKYQNLSDGFESFAVPSADGTAADKKTALESMLSATAPNTCAISLTLSQAGRANCYGPSVNYTNHEFNASSGSWPGGDLGIWEDSVSGESCAAAQLNAQMKGAISYVDLAQFIGAGMSCVANKNGKTFPSSEGVELDLSTDMASQVTVNSQVLTITTATIKRDTNDSAGHAVYITTLEGTSGTDSYLIRIKHVPTAADDSTNRGKISVRVRKASGTDGVSLEYEKASTTSGTLLLKKINFNATSADPFVSATNYTVDYSKSWNNNADYFLAQINPSDYTGTFSYAWQAGNGDSHTRVFNAKIETVGSATTGSTFFGFGPTMQTGPGTISGMICAWTGPDSTHTPVSKVQRQNIDLSSGKFIVSGTSYTVFDPVADCDADGAMSMDWNSGANTRTVSSTTANLVSLTEVTSAIGTLPTVPTAVE